MLVVSGALVFSKSLVKRTKCPFLYKRVVLGHQSHSGVIEAIGSSALSAASQLPGLLVVGRGGGGNAELVGPARLHRQVAHHELGHWRAADVPMADEEDSDRR